MRSFTLNDTINARRIKQLIAKIELCKSKSIIVYLCSHGGEAWMADIFIDFTHRTKKKIHFIAMGKMQSACVHIFLGAKGKKSVYPYTTAMLHLATYTPDSRDLLNKKSYDTVIMKEIEKFNIEMMKTYTEIFDLTAEEKSTLEGGLDLGISYDRLQKALPKIK